MNRARTALAGLAALTIATALTGCGADDPAVAPSTASTESAAAANDSATGIRTVGPQQFEQAIDDPDRVVINVHVPYEGEIAGTDLFIPFDQIEAQQDRLPTDRGVPLAVYCRSDHMSETAVQTLSELGFHDIVELDGGMVAWESSGRALISG
ncbi:MAG: rhodanese-like domain-containing protein [Actinomycetota bacterium]|nr:rhodanese-like domain-containing protein [Actinomycetota bacterium]